MKMVKILSSLTSLIDHIHLGVIALIHKKINKINNILITNHKNQVSHLEDKRQIKVTNLQEIALR